MGLENPLHIAIVLMVVLLVFGAKRLPEMGRGLGHGMRGFKEALTGNDEAPSLNVAAATASEPAEIKAPSAAEVSSSPAQ